MRRRSNALLAGTAISLLLAGGVGTVPPPAEAQPIPFAPEGAAAGAAAPSPVGAAELATRAEGIAGETVARWALLQAPTGRFPDPVAGAGEDYGTAMLGLAMARRGVERGDRSLVRGGLQAVLAEVERPTNGAFEPLVLAEAYRWGASALPGSPYADLWAQAGPILRADLVARPPAGEATVAARCLADPECWSNLKLVGALGSAVLLRTGLTSQVPGALLADPGLPVQIQATVATRVPEQTGDDVRRRGAAALDGGGLLSDPPRDPLAYHALSTALLGRLVDELGTSAPPEASAALNRASRALLTLAAPNGDLTWWGRGQGQVWVPAVAAEAAARAAARAPAGGTLRGRYLALVDTELRRLRTDYGVGAVGMPLVPGATDAAILRARSVDSYATTRGYNGLAVDALDRVPLLLRGLAGRATSVPSTRAGAVRSPSEGGLVTITRGNVWAAVASRDRGPEDARYGSGLLALQARDTRGDWAARIPARPHAAVRLATLSVLDRGELLPASGTVSPGGGSSSATFIGRFSRTAGGRAYDGGTVLRWSIAADGTVTVTFRAKATRTFVASALAGDGASVRRTERGVIVRAPDGTSVSYAFGVSGRHAGLDRTRRDVGGSAYDARLRAVDLALRARRGERVVLAIRPAGQPPAGGG